MRAELRRSGAVFVLCCGLVGPLILLGSAVAVASGGVVLASGVTVKAVIPTTGKNVRYSYPAVAGQHVTFAVSHPHWTGGPFATLNVYGPGGVFLNSAQVSTTTTEVDVTPSTTGTGSVVLVPNGLATGSVKLTFAIDVKGSLTSGVPLLSSISFPGQHAAYSYPAVAGQHVTFALSHPHWTGGPFATLNVYGPGGVFLNSAQVSTTTTEVDVTPSTTGTGSVVLVPNGLATGSVKLTFAADKTGSLTPGVPRAAKIKTPGQHDVYSYPAVAGQQATFTLTTPTWMGGPFVTLIVYGPGGVFLNAAQVSTATVQVEVTPTVTGSGSVVLAPAGLTTGFATITLS